MLVGDLLSRGFYATGKPEPAPLIGQAEAESLLAGHEYEVDSRRVLERVQESDCSAYDCEFAALAQQLDVKLVTMDAKLLKAFPKRAVSLV